MGHASLAIANGEVFGLWAHFLITGAYLVYFAQCVIVIVHGWKARPMSGWLLAAGLLIFCCTVNDQILAVVRAYQVQIATERGEPIEIAAYDAFTMSPISRAKDFFCFFQLFLYDLVLIYRTYLVWSMNVLVVAFPIFLAFLLFVIGVVGYIASLKIPSLDPYELKLWISFRYRYYFILTLCLNSLCSGLIMYKIWRTTSAVSDSSVLLREDYASNRPLHRVLRVIIQSATIHCALLLTICIADYDSVFHRVVLESVPPTSALVFSMLIVHAREETSVSTGAVLTSSMRFRRGDIELASIDTEWEDRTR